jgi:1-acyl-sn-glycerol-3-phosphate acyltransferase
MVTPAWNIRLVRRALRWFAWLVETLLTRTTITGLENIPRDGASPLIFAANHASTYDPVLLMLHIPLAVRPVGPGDFKLLWPASWVVENLGVIRIQRGAADRESLKIMTEVLKNGENLSLFPEGGTWEKRLDDVKPGVAYLSLTTGARIIPISIGGSYGVWRKIARLQRPKLTLHFSPPMPVVQSHDRKQRGEDLRQASLDLMQIIYDHLPAEEQARYDLYARQQFRGQIEAVPATLTLAGLPDFSALAELVSKPNLFSPLHQNLKLPLGPLMNQHRFYSGLEMNEAATALLEAFQAPLKDYLPYRMGAKKAAQALVELEALRHLSQQAMDQDVVLRFRPSVEVLDHPLPPNE